MNVQFNSTIEYDTLKCFFRLSDRIVKFLDIAEILMAAYQANPLSEKMVRLLRHQSFLKKLALFTRIEGIPLKLKLMNNAFKKF